MRFLKFLLVPFFCLAGNLPAAFAQTGWLEMRFVDSATGFEVRSEVVLTGAGTSSNLVVGSNGRLSLTLPAGDYAVAITSSNHAPMSAAISVGEAPQNLQFTLDPISGPREISAEAIAPFRRADATIFVGFVSGEDSGGPLPDVVVKAAPSGVETRTDANGFFRIAVPLQGDEEWKTAPAKLIFEKAGYQLEEHRNLELWPQGDWIWRVTMKPGSGLNRVDEEGRRISPNAALGMSLAPEAAPQVSFQNKIPVSNATHPTNATVRIPTNIRVRMTNGTIDYVTMETYTMRSLAQEWISSWGNYAGGINSMKAGAVAVRSYAAWFVSNPQSTTNDICATTSCQVYRTSTTTHASNAVMQTTGYVIVGSNNAISRSEYSSENNQLGMACGDGFTAPTGGCLADPVCTGEPEFGHGRGMCQWGTVKWATGRKFPSNDFSNTGLTNNQPVRDWIWIVNHYYPTLTLVQAKPLVMGDDVKIVGSSARDVRMCADGGISSGINCPLITTKAPGATGVITNGPVQVITDGRGYTWWKIVWSDGVVGWTPENWLERVIPVPAAPLNLRATASTPNRVNLTWSEQIGIKVGYKIERATASGGPWAEIDNVFTNALSAYSDMGAAPGATNFYRIRAYNLGGNSPFSNTTNAITPGIAPTLATIKNRTISEGLLLIFTNSATAPDHDLVVMEDFESAAPGSQAMFRTPRFSGSTDAYLEASPDVSAVTNNFPPGSGLGLQATRVNFSFNATANSWLRLTTSGATVRPTPVIDFTRCLRFNIHSDKAIKIAIGCRETTNAVGTPIGSNGGSSGALEWAGATGKTGDQPMCVRTIPANVWTTVTVDFPAEPIFNFVNGNNILNTASGLGVLEHLAIVPAEGPGAYDVYLDNFVVVRPRKLNFSLDAGAPAGASINPTNGIFTWTPAENQGPGSYPVTIRVTDDSAVPQSDFETFTISVTESNAAPVLAAIANRTIHAGSMVVVTNAATDLDFPANSLTYSLDAAPPGSSVNASSGIFSWTPSDSFVATSSNITVRVTDNGLPPQNDAKTFSVTVVSRPGLQNVSVSNGHIVFGWNSIPGVKYRVQFKNDLSEANWTDEPDPITANNSNATFTQALSMHQRFYRILVLD